MNPIVIEDKFIGENLVNLLANKIIKEYDKTDEKHKSFVKVYNFNNFIVIKGVTSISKNFNYSTIFREYINEVSGKQYNFNVIDLIEYNKPYSEDSTYINTSFYDKIISYEKKETVYKDLIINKELNPSDIYNTDLPICSVSSDLFGMSLFSKKIYYIYFNYISYNVFEKGLCSDLTFILHTNSKFNEINFENSTLRVLSQKSLYPINVIESCILDVFDLNPKYIINHLSLNKYDFENEILSVNPIWKKRDKVNELIIL